MKALSYILIGLFIVSCDFTERTSSKVESIILKDKYGNELSLNEPNNPNKITKFHRDNLDAYEVNVNLEVDNIFVDLNTEEEFISEIDLVGNLNIQRGKSSINIKVVSEDASSTSNYSIVIKKYSDDTKISSEEFTISHSTSKITTWILQARCSEFLSYLEKPDKGEFNGDIKMLDLNGEEIPDNDWIEPESTIVKVIADNGYTTKDYRFEFNAKDTSNFTVNNHEQFFQNGNLTQAAINSIEKKTLNDLKQNKGRVLKVFNWQNDIKFNLIREYFVGQEISQRRILKGSQNIE